MNQDEQQSIIRNSDSDWMEAFEQTKNYRDYLNNLKAVSHRGKITSYLITRGEIENLLTQKGQTLDGIRIYIGHEVFKSGEVAVRLFAVPVKMEDCKYNDYNVPDKDYLENKQKIVAPERNEFEVQLKSFSLETRDAESGQGLAVLRPCPYECSKVNALNSDNNFK